ncbi:hypothetical protein E4P40_05845 [Blastococcus sp. CT_GayMR20]|uniref:nSTAND1 domain-containing NTPase n=1 Tax=Blastococcus sp. CT_GayMR20 TaxID=2559609 RepID=UPI0010740322|nr:BTAD domain-containing putative transcriptional regulator [Blastococcus sp. CT_GayMR20]TFV91549.1 hypothetical protein E4P40_05845 [Blastococcus sp. CT_GayMR20]
MRIAVLGPLEVQADDLAPVAVPGAKERLLLAALTARAPGVVSTGSLVETLWDGAPPASARKSLQAHVVRLRSSLEPERPKGSTGRYVVRRGTGYALTVDRSSIDALHIADLAARGRARLASGDPGEAERQLCAAVDLWRGEPYADWPEATFAETERQRLDGIHAGAVAGLLEARLELGRHADVLPELEALVTAEPLREDWWRLLMLALYRAGRQADALAAGRRVRALLAEELGTEPGPGLRQAEAAILAQDPALESEPELSEPLPVLAGACPFKGLAAYQVDDAPLFHGRRRLVAALVARIVDASVVVVSGPSGAGKSSVVRAGLVPALARGALPGSGAWLPVIVTPGQHPVDVLAELTGESPPAGPVLLVCDQFEELWSPAVDPAERAAFLDAVLGLIDDGIVVRCVAVVRGDHVGRIAEHTAFTQRLGAAIVLVPALTAPELRAIVRDPAHSVGLDVAPELLDAVVADVLGEVGALPLLSTALVGTWERRRGNLLTLAGYLEAGGVAGALTRSAEGAYTALDAAGQELARRLLVRLADVDDAGALVRRSVPLGELGLDGGDGSARREVVEVFVGRRLLAVDGERLQVTHEALLTAWPRLARWLEDDAAGRVVRRNLAPAAREWVEGGRAPGELYRGARLAAALDWAASADGAPTPQEQQFLDASRARAEADLTEARDRADREAAARHRTRRLAAGLASVLVVALVATGLAVRAQGNAQQASLVADANRLAALSTTAGRPDVSLLLAAQAVRLASTPETQDGLLAALTEHRRAERVVAFEGDPFALHLAARGQGLFFYAGDQLMSGRTDPGSAPPVVVDGTEELTELGWRVTAPSPTQDVLLAAGWDHNGGPDDDAFEWVRTIDPDGSTRLILEGAAVGGFPVGGAFSADGRRIHLLVALTDEADPQFASRWSLTDIDAADGTVRDTGIGGYLPAPVDALSGHFTDDGSSAVLWDTGGTAAPVLIDLTGGRTAAARPERRSVASLDVRAIPSGAAQIWEDGAVTRYDGGGAPVQQLAAHREPVRDVVVAPDGTWAVTVGDAAAVVIWDIHPETGSWLQRDALTGHEGDVVEASIDPAGRRLVTMSRDRTVISWDMTADGGLGESYPGLGERWISNRPQLVEPLGLLVAPTRPGGSRDEAGTGPGPDTVSVAAAFLDPENGKVVDEVVVGDTVPDTAFGSSVAVSPDGSMVAVTWGLGTTVLDTRTREVVAELELPANAVADQDAQELPPTFVWCAGWTPDGSTLLLCASEGTALEPTRGYLEAVDTATWEFDDDQIEYGGAAQSIETSPDGRLLAVTSASAAEIVLLDAETFRVDRKLSLAADDRGGDLSFSRDGRLLASGGSFGLLYVFDTATWDAEWGPAAVHDTGVLQVEWLDDGRTVATSGIDGTVSLFDAERGMVRARPLTTSGQAGQGYAHLVPDATDELVVLSGERPGWRYPLDPSVWLDEACGIVGRDLTAAEWERYLPERERAPTCTDLP